MASASSNKESTITERASVVVAMIANAITKVDL
jgi:hypothetical protein